MMYYKMPKKPTDYTRTVIYKIEHNDNKEFVYVGSTTDFIRRKSNHKHCCSKEKNKDYNLKVYKMIRENGGWNEFQMLEIKKFPCNDKREAEAEEERCRVELKATLNGKRAFVEGTRDEYRKKYYEENLIEIKEKQKIYREDNKDKILERDREYKLINKENFLEKAKIYREDNKDKILEKQRLYRESNREKIREEQKLYREKKSI